MDIAIPGMGVVPVNSAEYTSSSVIQAYTTDLAILMQIFNNRPDANSSSAGLTSQDFTNLINAVKGLTDLLYNGKTDGTPPNTYVSHLTSNLATKLSVILQSLKAVGIDKNTNPNTINPMAQIDLMLRWQSLAGVGVQQALINAVNAIGPSPTRTLQSMIELEYVKNGNDIIFGQLQSLENQLKSSQKIIDTLQIIQSISNEIGAPIPKTLADPNTSNLSNQITTYEQNAKSTFTQLVPNPKPTSTSGFQLLGAKASLSSLIATLPPPSVSSYTLSFFLKKVVKDISTYFTGVDLTNKGAVSTAVYNWILDNQNLAVGKTSATGQTAGNIQDNITQAVQGAQSLNDTQKEAVNRYMFIFQEFYQSASDLLQKGSQIIEKMAQGISR